MATRRRSIKVGLGKERVTAPQFPSEPAFVEAANASARTVSDALLNILRRFEGVTPEVMLEAMQPAYDLAAIYVPKDTGDLADSEYLEITSFRGQPRVELGFASGGDPYYAIYVHEIADYKHASPTRYKFLQAGVLESLPLIEAKLAEGYKDATGIS